MKISNDSGIVVGVGSRLPGPNVSSGVGGIRSIVLVIFFLNSHERPFGDVLNVLSPVPLEADPVGTGE